MRTVILDEIEFDRLKKSRWFGWGIALILTLTNIYCLSTLRAQKAFWDKILDERAKVEKVQADQQTLSEAFTKSWEGELAANRVLIEVSNFIKQKQDEHYLNKVVLK
jgi:hypothetical protein